jgi:hypothetical protein
VRSCTLALAAIGVKQVTAGQLTTEAGAALDDAAKKAGNAAAEATASAEKAVEEVAEMDTGDGQTASCLALVSEGEFNQAIAVCTAALAANPANQQVQDALATAKTEAGQVAGAAGAAMDAGAQEAASDAASGAAADAAAGAVGNVLGN